MPRIPLISVIMSIYNGEKYLYQALCSILNQTLSNFVLASISLDQIIKDSCALSQEDRNKWIFVKTTIERDIKRLQS
jgi:hypothetical protein|tara:strand:+ start:2697 stop:2927 length:231 start_codon:yes stop_codon:yes gene_type:complete